jgi:hypothetical protein
MLLTMMLMISTSGSYAPPPDTPAGVANCLRRHAEKLADSKSSDALIAERVFEACSAQFEQMLAARDAAVAKEAGSPVPEQNRAEWRTTMTSHFRRTALHYVEMARRAH